MFLAYAELVWKYSGLWIVFLFIAVSKASNSKLNIIILCCNFES